jgi:rubrerythrin
MKEQPSIGMNRTGVQMSPFDSSNMQQAVPSSNAEVPPGDESAIAQIRTVYIEEAEPLGSVPVPGTVTGMVSTGMSMLTGNQPQLLLDKLGERLAFERTGTRLYDALIAKFQVKGPGTASMTAEELLEIRNDEARHFAVIASAIESIGGDPTSQTPCADLAGVESLGLLQVVTDPRTGLAQSLHAVLLAEMADNSGWDMLIALANDQGQPSMVPEFQLALDEEVEHLQKVQTWYEEATCGKVISNKAMGLGASSTQLH